MSSCELVVDGYLRQIQKDHNIDIPDDVILMIASFYRKYIEFEGGSIKLTDDEKEMITNWLNDVLLDSSQKHVSLSSTLLFDNIRDGKLAIDYQNKCSDNANMFGIVKIKSYDHIIGFFMSKPLDFEKMNIEDDKVFICLIRSCFEEIEPTIYKIKKEYAQEAYECGRYSYPRFGNCELVLYARGEGGAWPTQQSHFNPKVTGNRLAGGSEFKTPDAWYSLSWEYFNVFRID